jgi:hypothetical protein
MLAKGVEHEATRNCQPEDGQRQLERVWSAEETSMQGKERTKRLLHQKQEEERILLLVWKCVQWASEEGWDASQLGRCYDPTVKPGMCGKAYRTNRPLLKGISVRFPHY